VRRTASRASERGFFIFQTKIIQPGQATMLEKHQVKALSMQRATPWKNVNFAKVNELEARLRVVADRAANFNPNHERTDS
jgi:hypothetical protein